MSGNRLFYTLDGDLRFLAVGAPTLAYWGKTRKDVIGRKLTEVFPQAEGSDLLKALGEALQSLRPIRRKIGSLARTSDVLDVEVYPVNGELQVTFQPATPRGRG
jgi:hypothetical protein